MITKKKYRAYEKNASYETRPNIDCCEMHDTQLNRVYSQRPSHHQKKRTTCISAKYGNISRVCRACCMILKIL